MLVYNYLSNKIALIAILLWCSEVKEMPLQSLELKNVMEAHLHHHLELYHHL